MAITTALEMFRGEDRTFHFVAKVSDADGAAVVDITGWELEFTVAKEKNRSSKLFTVACVIDTAADGEYHATVPSNLTADIAPGKYYWDSWRVDAGSKRAVGIGQFTIIASVREPEA